MTRGHFGFLIISRDNGGVNVGFAVSSRFQRLHLTFQIAVFQQEFEDLEFPCKPFAYGHKWIHGLKGGQEGTFMKKKIPPATKETRVRFPVVVNTGHLGFSA